MGPLRRHASDPLDLRPDEEETPRPLSAFLVLPALNGACVNNQINDRVLVNNLIT